VTDYDLEKMVNSGLQCVGFFVGFVGINLILVATFLPGWKQNDRLQQQFDMNRKYEGLWMKCDHVATSGIWTCYNFRKFFLAMPDAIQVARGLSITSLVLGVFSVLIGVVGMDCTKIADESGAKPTMGLVSGILAVLSGFLIGFGVSWYAADVYQNFNDETGITQPGTQFVYGPCLSIGWAAMCIMIISGACLICGSLGNEEDESGRTWDNAPYAPGQPMGYSSSRAEYC